MVTSYYWTILSTNDTNTRLYAFSGKLKKTMHNFAMNPQNGLNVDHINGNSLDNRRCNLRICTFSDNMKNKSIDVRNKSGVTGVGWYQKGNSDTKAWKAYIRIDKKLINLGFFDDFDDAVKARRDAEEKYFGEFNRPIEHREVVNGC